MQDIQLELLRRTQINALDGGRVVESRSAPSQPVVGNALGSSGPCELCETDPSPDVRNLIKLRDLPDNFWNADTLFVLTDTHEKARELARIIEEEDWGGMVQVFEDQEEIDSHWEPAGMNTACSPCGGTSAARHNLQPHNRTRAGLGASGTKKLKRIQRLSGKPQGALDHTLDHVHQLSG